MENPSLFEPQVWSVGNLTSYLRGVIEADENLKNLWVGGEVSNVSRPASGHIYFTIKDRNASLRCVMWRTAVARQRYLPRDGEAVEAHGYISIYDAGGNYQLYTDLLRPAGEGALFQEFMRLKARLEAEGLFGEERKRPIPALPGRIGLVTSPSGAALRDILNTLRRRYPLVDVVLAPTAVQGDEAPPGIVAALGVLNRLDPRPDVILLARGGGSLEDLWAFNDERVVYAIAASAVPVITGVGHETDFTIADFVSDRRAPTPTAAAELATPDQEGLRLGLAEYRLRLQRLFVVRLQNERRRIEVALSRLERSSPLVFIRITQQRLDEYTRRFELNLRHALDLSVLRLQTGLQRLSALNPSAVLARGYSVIRRADGSLLRSIRQIAPGDPLQVQVADGNFTAGVISIPTPSEKNDDPAG